MQIYILMSIFRAKGGLTVKFLLNIIALLFFIYSVKQADPVCLD